MVIRREADGQVTEHIRKSSQKAAELHGEKKSVSRNNPDKQAFCRTSIKYNGKYAY